MTEFSNHRILAEIKARWAQGETPDARRMLAEYPQLRENKQVVVELGCEEYRQRKVRGELLEPAVFCDRFSLYRQSIMCRLEVEDFYDVNPDLLPDSDQAWPELGGEFAGFVLLEELGRGAVGRAYLAEELKLDRRRVVVKLTRAGHHEAVTLSRLQHPGVVPIYSMHEDPEYDLTVICMPFLGRWTLQDFLDAALEQRPARTYDGVVAAMQETERAPDMARNPSDTPYLAGVTGLIRGLAAALVHTHARGVYHLDLKPTNVLMTAAGVPLLLDFNLSIAGARLSAVGGTMPYMSPEQIQAIVLGAPSNSPVDARSDVYSLGVMFYQLVTGKHPYELTSWQRSKHEVAFDLLALQRRGPAAPITLCPELGSELDAIIRRAMAWSAADRFPTMAAFLAALNATQSPWRRWRRYRELHRRELLAGSLAAGVGLAAAALFFATREPYPDRELRHGWELFHAGENKAAEECFARVLEHDRTIADAWFGRGRSRQRQGAFTMAYDDFLEAGGGRLNNPEYAACVGFCALRASKYSEAVAAFRAADEGGLQSAELFNSLGRALQQMDLYPAAEAAYLRALDERPNASIVLYNYASLLNDMGRYKEAEVRALQALDGDNPAGEMFASAANYVAQSSVPGDEQKTLIRKCLARGRQYGLRWDDCWGPLRESLPDDDPLVDELKMQQKLPSSFAQRITDPLGDVAISEAAR